MKILSQIPSWPERCGPVSLALLLLAVALGSPARARITESFSYQARILDNQALANGTVSVWFRLFDDPTGGNLLYSENQVLTATDGLISAQIGANNPTPGSLFAAFANPPVYLQLIVDGDFLSPREEILSVPFAFNAQNLGGRDVSSFALANHQHDGADIVSGTIDEAFLDADVALDGDILPTVLANDGSGSFLDADLLDGKNSLSFLRSDTSDTFTGPSLFVRGNFEVGPNTNGDVDSRIRFGSAAEHLTWVEGSTSFELSDDLQVQGTLQTSGALFVGTDNPVGDDVIYFDSGTDEAFFWDDNAFPDPRFVLSDDLVLQGGLEAAGNLSVGTGNSNDDDVIYFDNGTDELIGWSEFLDGFVVSNDTVVQGLFQAEGDIYVGFGDNTDDDILYFDSGDEFLGWDDGLDGFVLTNDAIVQGVLQATGDLYVGFGNDSDDDILYFDDGDEFLRWNNPFTAFFLSNSLVVHGQLQADQDLHVGVGSGGDDDTIYFDADAEFLRWDEDDSRFRLSDGLVVNGDIHIMAGTIGRYLIFDEVEGLFPDKFFGWNEGFGNFRLSYGVTIGGDTRVDGDLFLGGGGSDDYIYFDHDTDEFLAWIDSEDRFRFSNDLNVAGTLTASTKNFRIDHPLDPANRYLHHTSVESPDMKTLYDGVVVLDENGEGWIELPSYFEALNRDFRYQLTAIGGPGPSLHVADEIANNRFRIAGGGPGLKVSWQVTGIRQDAYANARRSPVEVDKPADKRGTYLHPELFAKPQPETTAAK